MTTLFSKLRVLWILFLPVHLSNAQSGTVSGQLALPANSASSRVAVEKYKGKVSGQVDKAPLAVAGVWLERRGLGAPSNPPSITLAQKGYQFTNSLIVVPKGTTVFFPNQDNDHHNVYSLSRGNRFDLGRYKKGETPIPSRQFDREGLVRLRCEIHEHMNAHILVVNSPFFTVTDASGRFTLKNVPAGNYVLRATLNSKVSYETPISVTAGRTLKLPALQKK